MNENVGNNLPLKCIDLQEYYEEISDQFKQNQCHYQQSGKIKSSTSICSEIKYLGELIRFLQQYRQQQHHQQQKQQQQLQQQRTSLLLSNDYKQSNCPKSIADKQTTRKCLKIRRELYLILHFATDKCIDAQLYDYQFDVRCQRLSKHIEKFQNEMKKFSCPNDNNNNNQFSTLPGPYVSNSYVSYSYVINSYVSICPELRFLKNLVQYKHYHDCIQKWKIDRFLNYFTEKCMNEKIDTMSNVTCDNPLLEKILKSSDIDIHNKDIRIKNVSESCISFADDLLKLFINYLLKNCLTEHLSGTFICNRLRRRLCGNLHFVTNNCSDLEIHIANLPRKFKRILTEKRHFIVCSKFGY
ncbi:hypothetical protein DERP_011613 [Dermatophagoides pteronyssinus]|uniref:Uncharacterized protein n=1 Tax=Dermatophagoides pteronyssinus TaxID=6956 RepID=A0ABQ8JWJ7_DERPT|nr:hypothetical protein DERP_011613 [Dermatophagoides pteronyssinus]